MKKLLILLLLSLVAWAKPGWRNFAPDGESFLCEFPTTSKVSDSKTAESSYWLALEKGKYVLQVGYADGVVTATNTEECIQGMLKGLSIRETRRSTRRQGKLTVIDLIGVVGKGGGNDPFHMLVFPKTDRIYFVNTVTFKGAPQATAEHFLTSFQLK